MQFFEDEDVKDKPGYQSEKKLVDKLKKFFNNRKNTVVRHGYKIYPEDIILFIFPFAVLKVRHGYKIYPEDIILFIFPFAVLKVRHGYKIYPEELNFHLEADVLLFDDELGINIFEVKGVNIDQIKSIRDNIWKTENFYQNKNTIKPVYQVNRASEQIIEILDNHVLKDTLPKVGVKGIVVLPRIEYNDWLSRGFNNYKQFASNDF
ncbi:MAG: Pseudogene of conserved hypothetical protein [Methanobrevibacter sp. CfCl-M3]